VKTSAGEPLISMRPFAVMRCSLGLQKPSIPNIVGRRNKCARMSAYGHVGSATGG
jgi:hypothetical protein